MRILVTVLLMCVSTVALGQSEEELRDKFVHFLMMTTEEASEVLLAREDELRCLEGRTFEQCAEKTAIVCSLHRVMLANMDRRIAELRQVLSKHPYRYVQEGRPYRDKLLEYTMMAARWQNHFFKSDRCKGVR